MMSNLEKAIKAPLATQIQIVDVLSQPLPDSALSNLEAIAVRSRGLIPLHGQAFAQWLHETFPQSCPRPHANGVSHVQIESEERATETGDQVLEADGSTVSAEMMPAEDTSMIPSVAEHGHFAAEESTQLVVYACLAACCVAGAMWASQGVLVEANGFICTKAKSEKFRMPVLRVSMLSICLIATVYAADKMAVEAAKASTAEIVITAAMLFGFAAAGWTLMKNFQTKQSQLLPR